MTLTSIRMMRMGLLSVAGLSVGLTPALASSVIPLGYSTTSSGTAGSGTDSLLAVPASYAYTDTFVSGTGGTSVSSTNTAGFYDDFIFTISSATANSVTSTINLGGTLEIDNLKVALFNYTANEPLPLNDSSALVYGSSFNFGSPGSGTVAVLPATLLAPGTYGLEVQGTVSGSAGGSYSGTLNLAAAPVPLPAAAWLLFPGVAALGVFTRRRRNG